jgi:hypothetical protein
MTTRHLFIALSLLAPALLGGIALIMYRKRLWHEFPAFTAYALFHAFKIPLVAYFRFRPYATYTPYFFSHWITEAIAAVISLCVVYEIYGHVFSRFEGLKHLGKVMFQWAASILVLIAVVISASGYAHDFLDRWIVGILVLKQSVSLVKLGLVLFLFVFASYFRLRWPHYLFGITAGLALYATWDLAQQVAVFRFGPLPKAVDWVNNTIYNCTVFIWLSYLLTEKTETTNDFQFGGTEVQRWNTALLQMLNR